MNQKGSYFNRHQKLMKSRHYNKNSTSQQSPLPALQKKQEQKQSIMFQSFGKKQDPHPQISQEQLNLPFSEKTEQQIMYEQFKQIQKNYDQQLKNLQIQIDKLNSLADTQAKKVKQATIGLQGKKKQLKQAQIQFIQLQKVAQNQGRLQENNKIKQLQKALDNLKQSNQQKILQLTEQYNLIVAENKQIQSKMLIVETQYKKVLQFDPQDYDIQKQRLIQQQQTLKKQLQQMQKDEERLIRDIQKIQSMKPVSAQVHRKYLDLYQKIFISKEISKAQQIMALKQQEKRQKNECQRRKQWLKEKQNQIKIRQKRITSKNQLIQSLTSQIKDKSTTLLNMYQTQQQKFKK